MNKDNSRKEVALRPSAAKILPKLDQEAKSFDGSDYAFTKYLHRLARGFTLIEILIVIAIIAVLASAVLIGLGPVQRQGRDARRISDLRQTQNALELYYSKCGYYPGTTQASSPCSGFVQISAWSDLTNALTGSNIGVPQIPNDPTAGKNYFYGTDSAGTQYVIGATLEDPNNPAFQNSAQGTIFGVNCTAPVYCIRF